MKTIRILLCATIAILGFGCTQPTTHQNIVAVDPLNLWNDGDIRFHTQE